MTPAKRTRTPSARSKPAVHIDDDLVLVVDPVPVVEEIIVVEEVVAAVAPGAGTATAKTTGVTLKLFGNKDGKAPKDCR